jgi:chromosome segregation ATPase
MRPLAAAEPAAGAVAETVQVQELRLAREAAERRCAELDAALAKAQRELNELRSRYADLYLQSQERSRQMESLELQAAHLLVDRQALAADDPAAQALHALEDVRQAQVELVSQVRAFQGYLGSVLDVIEPSDAMRREITARCAELVASAERAFKPLSTVAGRGRRDLVVRTCRVLTVNDDLQVAVLDSGQDAGIRRGTQWKVVKDGTLKARLLVIEVRAGISAATVTEGRLGDLGPGTVVTAE